MRDIFRRLLEGAGYTVGVAASGVEALERLRADDTIAVLLLDLEMPGMDGVAVCQAMRADTTLSSIPVVLASGSGDVHVVAKELGVPAFLRKPVTRDELVAVIGRFCQPEA